MIAMEESKQQGKFATPNREVVSMPLESTPGEDHATVTPPTPNGKQVRFDAKPSEQAKRGVVSRRGGRYGSPSRSAIEYPTFRSQNPDSSIPSFPQDEITEPPRMVSSSEGEANIGEEFSSPAAKTEPRHSNFSPPPTESATTDKNKRTPIRSPQHQFHNLPSLHDAKLSSPCGIFLSPCPTSPSGFTSDEKREDHDRAVSTPTDFTMDFDKANELSSFDAPNVLAWLQSPTGHGLFSPGGGFGSALNTPRGAAPRTPTQTSFFFSDVASLPRNGEFASPKKRQGMISISPLAPKRKHAPRSMPLLGESPKLDIMSSTEQDIMEDEDLSELLQMAHSHNPRSKDMNVFRFPLDRKSDFHNEGNGNPLHMPIIDKHDGTSDTPKLLHNNSLDERTGSDFVPPPLGIRSSSSGASRREVFSRDDEDEKPVSNKSQESSKENDVSEIMRAKKKPSKSKKSKKGYMHAGYGMPPYPPHSDASYYPMRGAMPGMPPGGSMRVVMGGPPPLKSRPSSKNSSSPQLHSQSGSPSRRPHYHLPPEGYGAPPPPGSMYLPPPYPPPSHMGVPYGHYPPPPPHMSMYPSHPHMKTGKNSSKKGKGSKLSKSLPSSASKRPVPNITESSMIEKGSPPKKVRKNSPKEQMKKKTLLPPGPCPSSSVEEVDREKAAATIAAVNAASGGMNDRAAALAAAILRGVTMRPSGKWQAQLYYAGKSRYIGVFDTREKAALAYEIAREKLKSDKLSPADQNAQTLKATENAVNAARKAAFDGVNEKDPRASETEAVT